MPAAKKTARPAAKPGKKAAPARKPVPKVSLMAGKTVDDYVATVAPPMAAIIQALRPVIKAAAPDAAEVVKWAQAVYEQNGPMMYVKAATRHVTFGFWRGAMLKDPAGLLSGEGDRMKSMKLSSVSDINAKAIADLVKQALALNQTQGDPTKGK